MEIILVGFITLAALALFISERFPVELVALMVLAALLLFGLVTVEQGLSGFSSPATITIGAMFILSAALQKTGVVAVLGKMLMRLGRGNLGLLLVTILVSGLVSAFMNNTAAVAVFLPIIITISARRKTPASKFLIPLSYAAQFGGVCTLLGTSTNLLVSSLNEQAGYQPFSVFEFTPLGLIMMLAGTVYLCVVSWWLLPAHRMDQLTETFKLADYITELRVLAKSPQINKSIVESGFGQHHDVTVLRLLRNDREIWPFHLEPVRENDILLVRGTCDSLLDLKESEKLDILPQFTLSDEELRAQGTKLLQVLVAPRSRLIGHTLKEVNFRRRYNALVIAIHRREEQLLAKLNQVRLEMGDVLLLQLPEAEAARLRAEQNFIVLEELDTPEYRTKRAPIALGTMALVVLVAALGWLPIVATALIGAIAVVLTRCITLDEAYGAIDWRVIFLLAGILPLGLALQNSGAADLVAGATVAWAGNHGPLVLLAVFYLLTAVLTEIMSNNGTAVLMTPIAISTAATLGVDPRPFMMAICFAASTSFSTPVGYQTNTMVYNAGGYRFVDFLKIGVPLNLIFWGLAVYFIPIFWPF